MRIHVSAVTMKNTIISHNTAAGTQGGGSIYGVVALQSVNHHLSIMMQLIKEMK